MTIDADHVTKIADLARIAINMNDVPRYVQKLNTILGLIEQMKVVDTTGVLPLAHPLDSTQRFREDIVTQTNNREALLAIAPESKNGLYLVPQVIDKSCTT